MSKPVPSLRCTVVKQDGMRCRKWAIRGAQVCLTHGGALPNVRAHADAVVHNARMRLLDASDLAMDTIEDLLVQGTADAIRLKAATEVLDRIGVRGGYEVDVEVEHKVDAGSVLTSRLDALARRSADAKKSDFDLTMSQDAHDQAAQHDVIEGTVLPDDSQPTLF